MHGQTAPLKGDLMDARMARRVHIPRSKPASELKQMAKSASPAPLTPHSATATHVAKLAKPRERRASRTKPLTAASGGLTSLARAATAKPDASSVKPLLIGVGIGAALVGTAVVMHSKSDRTVSISPFHGKNSALAGALTKTALFAIARMVSGQTVRNVATRALLEVADAWKT
jgi:hypothetical protein